MTGYRSPLVRLGVVLLAASLATTPALSADSVAAGHEVIKVGGEAYIASGTMLIDSWGNLYPREKILKPEYDPSELVIKFNVPFEQQTQQNQEQRLLESSKFVPKGISIHSVQPLLTQIVASAGTGPTSVSGRDVGAQASMRSLENIYLISLAHHLYDDDQQLLNAFRDLPSVEWAEFKSYYYSHSIPNDPSYGDQDHLAQIEMPVAWQRERGDPKMVIAVVDTGVDLDHEDLRDNIWTNVREIPSDGIDNDHNGFVDDVHGWDFVSVPPSSVSDGEDYGPRDSDPQDFNGHGTHVSGIIAAEGNNGKGVTGVAWFASIMPLRAGYTNRLGVGTLESTDISDAIIYAANNGARVINMSFGSQTPSRLMKAAIDYAESRNCVLVASAGNAVSTNLNYPAAFENVLAVGATRSGNRKAEFSNYGLWIDLAAPGKDILSTEIDGYGTKSGTSMSAAVVSGLAGLILSDNPHLSATQVRTQLIRSSTNIDMTLVGFEGKLGAGLVSGAGLLTDQSETRKVNISNIFAVELQGDGDKELEVGELVSLLVTVENLGVPTTMNLELSSASSWISVESPSSGPLQLDEGDTRTTWERPFVFRILPGAPVNAAVQFDLAGDVDGVEFSRRFDLFVNPKYRSPLSIKSTRNGRTEGEIHDAGNGRLLIVSNADNSVQATFRNADASWSDEPILNSQGIANYPSTAASNTEITILYLKTIASFDLELFSRTLNLVENAWGNEIQITTDAEIFSIETGVDSGTALEWNEQGLLHLVWLDRRNGSPEIFHKVFDGQAWLPEEAIYSEESLPEVRNFSPKLFAEQDGGMRLFYTLRSEGHPHSYTMKYSGSEWSEPIELNQFPVQREVIGREGDYFLPHKVEDVNEWRLSRFDGREWEFAEQISDDPDFLLQFSKFGFGSSGSLETLSFMIDRDTLDAQTFRWRSNGDDWTGERIYREGIHGVLLDDFAFNANKEFHAALGTGKLTLARESGRALLTGYRVTQLIHQTTAEISAGHFPPPPAVAVPSELPSCWKINFTLSSDSPAEVKDYRYAIGSAPGADDIVQWTDSDDGLIGLELALIHLPVGTEFFVSASVRSNGLYESGLSVSQPISIPTANCPPEPTEPSTSCSLPTIRLRSQGDVDNFQRLFGGDSGCSAITSDMIISGKDIQNIDGLSAVRLIGGSLTIADNPQLQVLSGLSSLERVSGHLNIAHNSQLSDLAGLEGLKYVQDELRIHGNSELVSISGIWNTQADMQDLTITDNPALINLQGLNHLVGLTGNLNVSGNRSLTRVDALSNLNGVGGNVRVRSNLKLARCGALAMLLDGIDHALPGPGEGATPDVGGDVDLFDNLPGCNTVDEIVTPDQGESVGPKVPCSGCKQRLTRPLPSSGPWADPEQDGSGFLFRIQDGTLAGFYFGYGDAGDSDWLLMNGVLEPGDTPEVLWQLQTHLSRFTGGSCPGCDYAAPGEIEQTDMIRVEFLQKSHARFRVNGGAWHYVVPVLYGTAGYAYFPESTPYLFPEMAQANGDPAPWVYVINLVDNDGLDHTQSRLVHLNPNETMINQGGNTSFRVESVELTPLPNENPVLDISCAAGVDAETSVCMVTALDVEYQWLFTMPFANLGANRFYADDELGNSIEAFRIGYD